MFRPWQDELNPDIASPHDTTRHPREGGNPSSHYPNAQKNTPSFPRRREFNENIIQTDQIPHFHTGLPQHHSREGRNSPPHYPNAQKKTLRHSRKGRNSPPHYPNAQKKHSVIPAKAGIHCTIYHATLHPGTQGADIYTGLPCCINNYLVRLNR